MAYEYQDVEKKWNTYWQDNNIYAYNKADKTSPKFVVDTPPPTISGSLHIGHIFSYTQMDIQVRYKRMNKYNVFFPIGWDDNGLPTERRVQNYFDIKCNSNQPYIKDWKPTFNPDKKNAVIAEVSRQNFIEACEILAQSDEIIFENLFKSIGHSYDWSLKYATIDEHCRKTSQLSFLDLAEKNVVYNKEMPGMWDTTFNSAIAQAELEDREMSSKFYDIEFGLEKGGNFIISTTRPELLAACIAVVAHPDDERYKDLFGSYAITPIFGARVPIYASEHAVIEKGTGIMMVCTFGDIDDVNWWKQSNLPCKQIISKDGRVLDVNYGNFPFECQNQKNIENYNSLIGMHLNAARKQVVALLEENGAIKGCKDIVHAVKFYEKGDRPIEFVPSRQWFIDILNHKKDFLDQGRKIKWHPEHMLSRYENWVEGLNQDWCISRQRFFGVPFPVWYKVLPNGEADYANPIFATKEQLPVDPMITAPIGFEESMRGQIGGFIADPDVMDTWATSSVTPQIATNWAENPEEFKELFPTDLRAQAHDIIRTWAFYTIVKAWFHNKTIPWKDIAISGFIVDPDRKKMSKSKGNVVTPENLIVEYSADAVRYWAGKARLGSDTIYDTSLFLIGKKLVNKIYNVGNFVKTILDKSGQDYSDFTLSNINQPVDLALVEQMNSLLSKSTEAFEHYDYSTALLQTEELFWKYCDYYIELVKARAYGDEKTSARSSALSTMLHSYKLFLQLFAPFLPYVTEEMWSIFVKDSHSIHTEFWPKHNEVSNQYDNYLSSMMNVLDVVRMTKTKAQKNMRWPLAYMKIFGRQEELQKIKAILPDILAASNVNEKDVIFTEEQVLNINVALREEN